MTKSAEQSAVDRAEFGVSDVQMTGPWRAIIARVLGRYSVSYYHENDDTRLSAALWRNANAWFSANRAEG